MFCQIRQTQIFVRDGINVVFQQTSLITDGVKPVHEGLHESHATYRPNIVGGPIGHVVGHAPVRPTTRPQETTTPRRLHYHTRYPPRTTEAVYTTRPSRPRAYNDGIFSSFVDLLLFK